MTCFYFAVLLFRYNVQLFDAYDLAMCDALQIANTLTTKTMMPNEYVFPSNFDSRQYKSIHRIIVDGLTSLLCCATKTLTFPTTRNESHNHFFYCRALIIVFLGIVLLPTRLRILIASFRQKCDAHKDLSIYFIFFIYLPHIY